MSTCSKHVEAWNKLIIKFSAPSWLILINKGNRKSHHIYVLDQHCGSLRLAVTGNKILHPICRRPNAGTSGGGGGHTARDVNVCSQVSSLLDEHQLAAALPWNTTQAADSVTFSWLTLVKQQQAATAQCSHHSYSRHLAASPNCLSVRHKMFCSPTLILATYSVPTWRMSQGGSFRHGSKSCLNVWMKGFEHKYLNKKKLYTCKSSKMCDWDYLKPPTILWVILGGGNIF